MHRLRTMALANHALTRFAPARVKCVRPGRGAHVCSQICRGLSKRAGCASVKPLRSALYTPGSSRHLRKARDIPCDASLIDLEDGVAPGEKLAAREKVCRELQEGGPFKRKAAVVRINGMDTDWGLDDLKAIAGLPLDAICLPKVESGAEVVEVARLLETYGTGGTGIWCMIETPLGVMRADEIASSHESVTCLVMGTSDLSRDLHANHTADRAPLMYSLSRCVVAARSYGLQILDGVHLDMTDEEGFEQSCRQGRDLGMDGKTLIHPKTVDVANWFFGPNAFEVEESYRTLKAYEEAVARGEGCGVLDGRLVEKLHAENAQRVIALHEAIAGRGTLAPPRA